MDSFSPAVVTSRVAKNHYQNIVGNYSDIMQNLSAHQVRLQQVNQQKDAERANQLSMQGEMDKAKMTAGSQDFKTALDFSAKQASNDIKMASQTL